MRAVIVASVICLSVVSLSVAQDARAAARIRTDIPPQSLGSALQAFAQARDLQVLYFSGLVKDLKTGGATGALTADEALTQLLSGTGLTYRYVGQNAVTIVSAGVDGSAATQLPNSPRPPSAQKEGKRASSSEFRMAQVDQEASGGAAAVNATPRDAHDAGTPLLQEVVVTAQKRSERLQDVPVPVTALSTESLLQQNQVRLQDYATSVPGLNVAPQPAFGQVLSIRGITTGPGENPSVGITIDDIPFGSSTYVGYGAVVPDLDPADLARIEVLRGPQGALYGASSLGGLIKFVTADPSTSELTGRLEAGTSGVSNGSDWGYSFRGSANVPVSTDFAVRASAFTRLDPGYIDNIITHREGVNEQRVSGGRLSGLWRPIEDVSVKLSALYQDFRSDGTADVSPGLTGLQQAWTPGTGPSTGKIQAYSATVNAKLGAGIDFVSLTGYNIREAQTSVDVSSAYGGFAEQVYNVGTTALVSASKTNKFSQEMRLSVPLGSHFEWLLGGFYTHEGSTVRQDINAVTPDSGAVVANGLRTTTPSIYAESAAFTDLTWHITDQFDIQTGGRWSSIQQSLQNTLAAPLLGAPASQAGATTHSSAHPVTYLLTPRFKLSPQLMVYARIASGYRPGGSNGPLCGIFKFSCEYSPDKTYNYELGAKGTILDHVLSYDVSLYRINWKDIQLHAVVPPGIGYLSNASEAKSQGLELSLEARPLTGLTAAAWATWNTAELTEPLPADATAQGVSGDRLPYSSRFSGNFSLNQDFPLPHNLTGFAGGSVSYVGNRLGAFAGAGSVVAPRVYLPAYARTDAHAGVRYDTWTVNAYVNNAFDKRGILESGADLLPVATLYIQPRTFGVNLTKVF
jgi:iron complex outermembrane recepter protein